MDKLPNPKFTFAYVAKWVFVQTISMETYAFCTPKH